MGEVSDVCGITFQIHVSPRDLTQIIVMFAAALCVVGASQMTLRGRIRSSLQAGPNVAALVDCLGTCGMARCPSTIGRRYRGAVIGSR